MEPSEGCKAFVKACVLLFILLNTVNDTYAATEKCRGAFDVYFVLDRSSSLIKKETNHFKSDAVPFVEKLSEMFVSPLLRMSFITFADTARLVLPLSGDRNKIERKLQELKEVVPHGPTLMELGLERATQQIRNSKDKRASVIIALTDGRLEAKSKVKSVAQANIARSLGSTVFMVGVSNYDEKQLLDVAGGKQNLVFQATDFNQLALLADQILDTSCVEILSARPSFVCINETFTVRIYGNGFAPNDDASHTMCSFWSDEEEGILIKPKEATDSFLMCESPKDFYFQNEQKITVQVSLNRGLSFVSSNVTIDAFECGTNTTFIWLGFMLLFTLLFIGLWWMWNFITCRKSPKKQREPPVPSRPPPPPAPSNQSPEPKHWPAVDASYYGGAGAGGIKPVPVRWGDKGCTEAASHLEKTKDAKEISINVRPKADENENDMTPRKSDSLCTKLAGIFSPITACYTWIASKRPSNDDVRNCICVRKA